MALLKYISIQILAYVIDLGLFTFLLYLGYFGPLMANVLGKLAAGIFAFILHRSFTFKLEKQDHNRNQAVKYFTLLGLNIPFTALLLALLLLIIPLPIYSKILSDVIGVLLSFWLSKNWVFTQKR